jgi:hypothetical protein
MTSIERQVINLARGAFSAKTVRPGDRLCALAVSPHDRICFGLGLEDDLGITLTDSEVHKIEVSDTTTIGDICKIIERHFHINRKDGHR